MAALDFPNAIGQIYYRAATTVVDTTPTDRSTLISNFSGTEIPNIVEATMNVGGERFDLLNGLPQTSHYMKEITIKTQDWDTAVASDTAYDIMFVYLLGRGKLQLRSLAVSCVG